jgi:hypothetical protein
MVNGLQGAWIIGKFGGVRHYDGRIGPSTGLIFAPTHQYSQAYDRF